ncbi:two-component system sensor histidine kinase BarA [Oceanisphaera litoralis]|uniref:two-component sensor histidine kinase BarA n=1 Tax=Oceanisphaera litoralis TaxID=225144 RepID=UPI00195E4C94|nr:two-component sensor histidine kinase BarA [Oceanisphaera litoralis]MBM7455300.1 two-component system sensor histidine kinase BarA [Oceanisphaera litoralis]
MTKYGLRARILAYTIIPTLLIGILLAGYFSVSRYQQLEEVLIRQGVNVIEPLALASELALTSRNREALNRLLSTIHRNNSPLVKSIALFDAQGRLLVTSNYHRDFSAMRLSEQVPLPLVTLVENNEDGIILRTPVLTDHIRADTAWEDASAIPIGYIAMQLTKDSVTLLHYKDSFFAGLMVLLGVSLSGLIGVRLIRSVSQPITDMVSAVYKIREGRLDTRVNGEFTGEMEMLKNGINAMAKSLSEYHDEMQQNIDQATSDLRETLEQIEIQNIELDMAKKRAQEAARVKTEFLANMSHELRTPLNGVIGFARQLQKTRLTPNQLDYLKTIERSAQNLLGIINDILDFSKLEAGKLKMEQLPFSLRDTLQEVMTLLAPSAHDKGLELSMRVDAAVHDAVIGDPLRLQQVLTNLVGNAVKFTEQGNVDVRVDARPAGQPDKTALRIHVQDTGIGISDSQRRQLFQAFNQADSSISRRYGGTGLGLVITQKLVHQMSGEMELYSELGSGSVFSFTLELNRASLPLAEPLPLAELCNKTVLYLEEDNFSRRATTALLREWGVQVLHEPYSGVAIDCALLGFGPNTLPSQMEQGIQQQKEEDNRVVVLLSSTDPTLADALLCAGAELCLSKPVHYQKLAQALMGQAVAEPEAMLQITLAPPSQKQKLRVLAVDDNPANLKLISAMLSEQVSQVESCSNGQEALNLATVNRYDIIFMDIQMPLMDGIQATREIRSQDGPNASTPIVAVTAHAIAGERDRLMHQGMDDYLAKPIDETILARIIERFARRPRPAGQIDWSLAVKQAGGKEPLAREMLELLLQSFDEFSPLLGAALSGELDEQRLYPPLHKLHGGTAYCGVPQLQSLVAQLEKALLDKQGVDELEPELLELEERMGQIREEAKFYL